MNIRYILFSLLGLLFWTSCSTTQFVSDSLGDVDPNLYHTYTMEDNCSDDINPIMQIRIKNAIESKLRNNDYSKNDNADLLIKYFVKNLSKKYVEECREEYNRWEGGKLCQERVVTYVEGSIVIDIIDTKTNSIIWHGAAYGPSWSSISNPNQKVNEVVNTLLTKYFNS
ncbi:MAG: DUF4136 domain-containing protein [Saprospiraceae bacterium]|nr:DUF4136 domain-containing protein [Saprospiraceae bacterium]